MRRPWILTGGPAAGKSTCASILARARPRAAYIDVDDIRQLVVAGAAAPWEGASGTAQSRLGAKNACELAKNFRAGGFEVIVADVVTSLTIETYRKLLPDALLVRLQISVECARSRAATRMTYLTDEQFEALHRRDSRTRLEADHVIAVDGLGLDEQVAAIESIWAVIGKDLAG